MLAPLGWFVGCAVFWIAVGADVFYKTDGPDLLRLLHEGNPHPWHVGYLPLLSLWRDLLGAVGIELSLLRLGTSLSAVGAAAGVAFVRAAAGRLSSRRCAELATALVALNPATMLFATVVEFHAVQFAAVGAATWWAVRTAQARWSRPAMVGAMVGLAVLTHAAFLLHSSGLLLPAWVLPFWCAVRLREGGSVREWWLPAIAGAVHLALWLALPQVFVAFYGVHGDFRRAYSMETSIGRPQSIDWTPVIFAQEWLRPLAPISVLCVLAALRRALRLELLALGIGLVPFLYLCVRQLVFEPENGAYLLPLVPAAALLTARSLPRPPAYGIAVAALSVVLAVSVRHRELPGEGSYKAFVAALRAAAAGQPFFALLGRHDEMAIAYARLVPDRDFVWIRSQATMERELYAPQMWQATAAGLRVLEGQGRVLLATQGALDWLRDPAAMRLQEKAALAPIPNERFAGPLVLQDLERTFELVPAAPGVFRLAWKP